MLFYRKLERPPILIRIGSHVLPQTMTYKYLGVFSDCGLRWNTQTKYVKRKCLQRINSPSNLFYTDGSLMDEVAGFAVHHSIGCNIGLRMKGPTSFFTAELAAMNHIENEALGRYLTTNFSLRYAFSVMLRFGYKSLIDNNLSLGTKHPSVLRIFHLNKVFDDRILHKTTLN
jgi:hypothetical protein